MTGFLRVSGDGGVIARQSPDVVYFHTTSDFYNWVSLLCRLLIWGPVATGGSH